LISISKISTLDNLCERALTFPLQLSLSHLALERDHIHIRHMNPG
jgi:hypothetical protein